MIVYLRGNLVVFVGSPPPIYLQFDNILPNATGAAVGQVWNGSAFVAPTANSEQANLATLMSQADTALTDNQTANAALVTWRTTGPGAGSASLTLAQLSTAARTAALNQEAQFRQLNGIIRQLRAKLDATT